MTQMDSTATSAATSAAPFSRSLALFDAQSALVDWNEDFAREFTDAAALLRPGLAARAIVDACLLPPRALDLSWALSDTASTGPLSFRYINGRNGVSVLLERSASGGVLRSASLISGVKVHRQLSERDGERLRSGALRLAAAVAQRRNREDVVQREHIARLRDEAEKSAALATLGKLVLSFAHDIGSPIGNGLNVLDTVAENARQVDIELKNNVIRRSALNDFVASTQAGMTMARRNLERAAEMLDRFKLQALDHATGQSRVVRLRAWLEDLLLTLSPLFAGTGHSCRLEVAPDLSFRTQPGALGQVLTNLIANAVVHGFAHKDAGTIRIAAELAPDGVLHLRVEDDGAGMDAATQAHAFDPFFTTRADSGGTGLGLDIVRQMVVGNLHGDVALSSTPGAGTCFTLRLPPAPADA